MSGLETVPGQVGYLVINADGTVLQSAGELQNDERTAGIVLQMVQNCGKLMNTCSTDRKGNFHRMSVVFRDCTLVACVWNQKVHIVKKMN